MTEPIYGIWHESPTGDSYWWRCGAGGEIFHTKSHIIALAQLHAMGETHQAYIGDKKSGLSRNSIRRIDQWAMREQGNIYMKEQERKEYLKKLKAEILTIQEVAQREDIDRWEVEEGNVRLQDIKKELDVLRNI